MRSDEGAIRELVAEWMRRTAAGDVDGVLELMDEEVVFLRAGQAPMRGRAAFAQSAKGIAGQKFEGRGDVQEVRVFGDWAYCWTQLRVVMTPPGGTRVERTGPVLSVLRRQPLGGWAIYRDANMLGADG